MRLTLLILAIIMTFTLSACQKEGPAEKAGKKIDKTVNSVEKKVKDATK